MNDNQRLHDAFQYVKKTFFPRWDKKNQWRVVYDPDSIKETFERTRRSLKKQANELRGYPGYNKEWEKEIPIIDAIDFDLDFQPESVVAEFSLAKKEICFFQIPENIDSLYVTLVHEICHKNSPHHNEEWANAMYKAADIAERIAPHLVQPIIDDLDRANAWW
jgi:hypothetical protein